MIRTILICTSVIFSVTACGPSQTARDANHQQQDLNIDQQKALNDSIQGTYDGTMTDALGKKSKYRLIIVSTVFLQYVPATNEVESIPTLNGSFNAPFENGYTVIADYNTGTYNPHTGRVQMWAQITGSSAGFAGVDLKVEGNHLFGNYFAPNLTSSDLDLHKAE